MINNIYQKKRYIIKECVTFKKTHEKNGGLSNMAAGYPIYFNDIRIPTSEALYQACRFPNHPEIQKEIISQRSPMTAKDISRKYNYLTRNDWTEKRVAIMNWCLHLKLLYNWNKFGHLLMSTENKDIVEISSKDDFWGAFERGYFAEGCNILGRLLQCTRSDYMTNQGKVNIVLGHPNVENFCLFGIPVKDIKIDVTKNYHEGENYSLFNDYGLW